MGDKDVDEQFAAIVAHWDDTQSDDGQSDEALPEDATADGFAGSTGPGAWTGVNPPITPAPSPTNPPPTRPFVVWRGAEQGVGATGGADRRGADEPDDDYRDPVELVDLDDDEHFEPGPVAPLPPQEDLQFWGIVVGLVAGPLLLLWLVLFRPDVSDWWTLGALGLTVAGFVLLVLRQPHSRDEDDPDNGARV